MVNSHVTSIPFLSVEMKSLSRCLRIGVNGLTGDSELNAGARRRGFDSGTVYGGGGGEFGVLQHATTCHMMYGI